MTLRGRYGWCSAHSVSVGNVNRNSDGWYATVNRLDNDNLWNPDNRLLVRNTLLSSAINSGSFLFQIYLPSDEHFAGVDKESANVHMLRVGYGVTLPTDE